jgi:hypothetical protein
LVFQTANDDLRVLLLARTYATVAREDPDGLFVSSGVEPGAIPDGVTVMRPIQKLNWTKYAAAAQQFVLSLDPLRT